MTPSLSVILLTTGNQPLIRYSITSILPQLLPSDDFCISINTQDIDKVRSTLEIITELDTQGIIKVLETKEPLGVYGHYKFAISHARNEHLMLAHDDEIYNAETLNELRTGFSIPDVTTVVGGMLKVELGKKNLGFQIVNHCELPHVRNGIEWIKENEGLYPHFCFSALAVNKNVINTEIFSSSSTCADCLVVIQQAIAGSVYQSDKVFATWLQLPNRNSRWFLITPGLISPWKEFLDYYTRLGDEALIARANLAKKQSYITFLRMLFGVAVVKKDPLLIASAITKIRETRPMLGFLLRPLEQSLIYRLLAIPLSLVSRIVRERKEARFDLTSHSIDPPSLLGLDQALWNTYSTAVLKLR